MWDSVAWANLEGKEGAKAGYVDGRVSAWPAEAWQTFVHDPTLHITVQADAAWECFDAEHGDASNDQVAAANVVRHGKGQWSADYSNEANLPDLTRALAARGLSWTDARFWPAPGVYLWAADPDGNIKAGKWVPPVTPIAVQDEWTAEWDHSTTRDGFPALPAPAPAPTPPPPPAPTVPYLEDDMGFIAANATTEFLVQGGVKIAIGDPAELEILAKTVPHLDGPIPLTLARIPTSTTDAQ
jgi:hypothetical protein